VLVAKQTAYPDAVGIKRAKKGDDLHSALYVHVDGSMKIPMHVPPAARLQVGLAVEAAKSVQLEILVEQRWPSAAGHARRVVEAKQWTDTRTSLEPWSGKNVSLIVRADSDENRRRRPWRSRSFMSR
jgi:hypothetical protein